MQDDDSAYKQLVAWTDRVRGNDFELQKAGLFLFNFDLDNINSDTKDLEVPNTGQGFSKMVQEALEKWEQTYG